MHSSILSSYNTVLNKNNKLSAIAILAIVSVILPIPFLNRDGIT